MCDETEAHRSEETCSRPTSATRHQSQGPEAPAGCGSWESWSRWAWAGPEQVVLALQPLVIVIWMAPVQGCQLHVLIQTLVPNLGPGPHLPK